MSIAYFVAGTKLSPSVSEAFGNLGFVALRYRNGALAKKYFKRAVALSPKNTPFLFGLSTALIQNGEYKEAKALLLSTINQAPLDPIAHLALAYFLLDIEKNSEAASQLLTKYVSQNGTRDTYIQLALQSLRKSAAVKAKDKMIND